LQKQSQVVSQPTLATELLSSTTLIFRRLKARRDQLRCGAYLRHLAGKETRGGRQGNGEGTVFVTTFADELLALAHGQNPNALQLNVEVRSSGNLQNSRALSERSQVRILPATADFCVRLVTENYCLLLFQESRMHNR
jgi:hypothetical protein